MLRVVDIIIYLLRANKKDYSQNKEMKNKRQKNKKTKKQKNKKTKKQKNKIFRKIFWKIR